MCGIVGYSGINSKKLIRHLTSMLSHRGPDGFGIYDSDKNNVSLGHRRLSIIDINDGDQPMIDFKKKFVIVFNGEIYNHQELRKELISRRCIFKTDHSDTEVILNGYSLWGSKVLDKLNGMFSFCIYDIEKKIFFLAVDRFSKKPLYYSDSNNKFIFASQLDVITKSKFTDNEIDNTSLIKYYAYGFVPFPRTIYKNIKKLKGGTYLIYDLTKNKLSEKKYYNYVINEDCQYHKRKENEIIEEFNYHLKNAVKTRLISDRPLGIFLSGGVDSSLILALAREKNSKSIKTFSIGFSDKTFDESFYSDYLSELFQTNHFKRKLNFNKIDNEILRIIKKIDEPFNDSSIIPTFYLSKYTSQHVKVALSGDGADEMFCGYSTFNAAKFSKYFSFLSNKSLIKPINSFLNTLPASEKYLSIDFKLKRFFGAMQYPKKLWNPLWLAPLNPEELNSLFDEKLEIDEIYSEVIDCYNKNHNLSFIDQTSMFYINFYLQNLILVKADRASMMNGLEVRSPFLDNDVVDFSARLPTNFKFRGNTGKYIVKKSLERFLDKKFIYRKKHGFAAPISKWLKTQKNIFSNNSKSNLFSNNFLSKSFTDHINNKKDHRLFLWSYLLSKKYL